MGAFCQAGLKFMCGIEGRWVAEINHKIGVEGCSINILIAQLPNRPHVMRAQLRRVERFTAAGGMGRISLQLQGNSLAQVFPTAVANYSAGREILTCRTQSQ